MRQTSIRAYNEVCACGFLIESVRAVYRCIYRNGAQYGVDQGLTQTETWQLLGTQSKKDSYGPRFALLVRMGLLQELGKRPCHCTGKTVLCYDVTANLPEEGKKQKHESKTARLKRQLLAMHEAVVKFLEAHPEHESEFFDLL
jgi:hypothetical protein